MFKITLSYVPKYICCPSDVLAKNMPVSMYELDKVRDKEILSINNFDGSEHVGWLEQCLQ